ncbi:cell wall assembly protein [Shouchella clausii]|uniref:SMI1/KNR4 family protein n=1 Tax=Shouchella clausii TaxID=79880 RepID=UPI000BA70D00|nr:SMI1/KNR4 family protein [Shouchella clausii]MBU8595460.1 SMI1/KNR4 family protein [Shouchella clausii]MCY1103507.1 SMI1/KNR4 family protein [Shouchella clausii]MEB5480255.1 SMI1/KNR4 family protein [Shouchella clausii]MED4157285.1 SMI1/KNR4 family protein [Shouchella clausii]MED4178046.1 SMI1/KNR4 family protein [Shouchella clausii]
MSVETYQKAKEIIMNEEEIADFVGGRTDELISLAEEKLGLKFTGLYLDYLKTFGAGNFGAQEIYGIIDADFENSSVPDAIWYTLTERKEIRLPDNLLVIYDTGSDELFCLDFNQSDDNGEPKVVSLVPGVDIESQTYEIIANDFGDFLLDLVKQEV